MSISDFVNMLKRISIELTAMVVIVLLLFYFGLSSSSSMGAALLMYKALLFSASQVHAMITRKVFFNYINFSEADLGSKAMIIAIHVASAFVYSQGG